jgi:hypothetical protein
MRAHGDEVRKAIHAKMQRREQHSYADDCKRCIYLKC